MSDYLWEEADKLSRLFKGILPAEIVRKFIIGEYSLDRLKLKNLTIACSEEQNKLFESHLHKGYYEKYMDYDDWYVLTDKGRELLCFINL